MQPNSNTKVKRNVIHSIPIRSLLSNINNQSNVLSSIPNCLSALLLLGIVSVSSILLNTLLNTFPCSAAEPTATLSIGQEGLNATVTPGHIAYASSTISASTTGTSSYKLTITGPVGLTGGTTISGAGNRTPSAMNPNSWGYSYNQNNLTNENKTYQSFTGKEQDLASGEIANITNANITFVAKFGTDAIPAHYTADVVIGLVATPQAVTYTITYDTGGNGTIAPTSCTIQGAKSGNCNATITSEIPNKGVMYKFLGWADTANATVAKYTSGSIAGITASKTIYAVWEYVPLTVINNYNWGTTTMQNFTSAMCNNAPYGATNKLTDSRNSKQYTITKFYDGKCWMTDNLQISGTIQASVSDFSNPSSLTIPDALSGFTPENQDTLKGYIDTSKNTGYYNWFTATAQAGNSNASTDNQNVNTSICPSGWTLPTGGTTGNTDFYNLFATTNPDLYVTWPIPIDGHSSWKTGDSIPTELSNSPYNFTTISGGSINGNSIVYPSTVYWWSRTSSSDDITAYALGIVTEKNDYSSGAYPGTGNDNLRFRGRPIRCIAK